MTHILHIAAITFATFGTGAATLSVMNEDIPDLAIPEGNWATTGALDGMTFQVSGKDVDRGAELTDEIVFRDGTFQSTDCEQYCNFGWSDYQTKEVDGVIHFTATTICPDAPHTVVWYGTVSGGTASIDVTWTTRRWYWTNQMRIQGTGTALPSAAVTS